MNIATNYPTSIPNVYCVNLANELMVRGTHDPEVAKRVWDEVGFPLDQLDWYEALPIYASGVYFRPDYPEDMQFSTYSDEPGEGHVPILVEGNNWPENPDYIITRLLTERTK